MFNLIKQFSNRELAITIWIMSIVMFCIYSSKIRPNLFAVVKAFFAWKLTLGYIIMMLYISILTIALHYIGIWHKTSLSTTMIWIICVAFTMLFNSDNTNKRNFFTSKIKQNFRFIIIIEFMVNFYTLSLWIELLLVPIMAMIGGMMAIAERDSQYEPTNKLLSIFLSITGFLLIGYALRMAIIDFKHFANISTLETFILPIILTLAFIPFLYMVALYATYESCFIKLRFIVQDRLLIKHTKKRMFQVFHFRLAALDEWSKNLYALDFMDYQTIDEAILKFNTDFITSDAKII